MDKTKNKFITYLEMFLIGLFIGGCVGLIILFATVYTGHTFWLIILSAVSIVLSWKFLNKYDYNIFFGIAISFGISIICGTFFMDSPKNTDAFTAFAMIFMVFFMQYAFLALLRHTIRQIVNKKK